MKTLGKFIASLLAIAISAGVGFLIHQFFFVQILLVGAMAGIMVWNIWTKEEEFVPVETLPIESEGSYDMN